MYPCILFSSVFQFEFNAFLIQEDLNLYQFWCRILPIPSSDGRQIASLHARTARKEEKHGGCEETKPNF